MLNPKKKAEGPVAVAINRDRRSQDALRWAVNHILPKGQTVTLIHVNPISTPSMCAPTRNVANIQESDHRQAMEVFLPFHCFCSCKKVPCEDVTLEDQDVANALIEYVSCNIVNTLVLGAPSKNGISRLFKNDIPSIVLRGAPYFCNVYVISKGKVVSTRSASRPLPSNPAPQRIETKPQDHGTDFKDGAADNRLHDEVTLPDTDISVVSPERMSTDSMFFNFYDNLGYELTKQPSKCLDKNNSNFEQLCPNSKLDDLDSVDEFSSVRQQSKSRKSRPLQSINDGEEATSCMAMNKRSSLYEEAEERMRRLELQMKQTMDMYHTACREALAAKQKARELQLLKMEDEKRLKEAEKAKEEAMLIAEKEKEKVKAAMEVANRAHRQAELEAQKRAIAEMQALKEAANEEMMLDSSGDPHIVHRFQSLLHIIVVVSIFYFYFF